mgnify:CR=1 FL=1
MNSEDFIQGLLNIRKQACEGIIENLDDPPGRKPRRKDLDLSKFYHSLSQEQKANLGKVIEESVDMALFIFLCILDHVHFLEDTPDKTQFELYAIKNNQRILLNDFDTTSLHDEFNSYVLDPE